MSGATMFDPALFTSVLPLLGYFAKTTILPRLMNKAQLDYVYEDENGKKIGVEVKGGNINFAQIKRQFESIQSLQPKLDKYFLLTKSPPTRPEYDEFLSIAKEYRVDASWITAKKFFKNFGVKLETTEDVNKLQMAAITSNIKKYDKSHVGLVQDKGEALKKVADVVEDVNKKISYFDRMLISLGRQLPFSVLTKMNKCQNDCDVSKYLQIGKCSDDVVVVLSDMKNFSSIVTASSPDILNEMMSKYYVKVRSLVFKYGGVLDKFIGDAVLAIFNYPDKRDNSLINSIKFAAELIVLGRSMLSELLAYSDNELKTGTRVGITVGKIYILNIGTEHIEITFVGDKINLASRLEKKCEVNGILLSNFARKKLEIQSYEFLKKLDLELVQINKEDAKGQISGIKAWQVKSVNVESIFSEEY